jgi:hypothetical protein
LISLDSVRSSLTLALAYFTYGVLFNVYCFFAANTSSSCFAFKLLIDTVDPVGGIRANLGLGFVAVSLLSVVCCPWLSSWVTDYWSTVERTVNFASELKFMLFVLKSVTLRFWLPAELRLV